MLKVALMSIRLRIISPLFEVLFSKILGLFSFVRLSIRVCCKVRSYSFVSVFEEMNPYMVHLLSRENYKENIIEKHKKVTMLLNRWSCYNVYFSCFEN